MDAGKTSSFTIKDFITIGISVLALSITVFFDILLKTDDVRGTLLGSPGFRLEDGDLYVTAGAKLAATNTGNRPISILNASLKVQVRRNDSVTGRPCEDGDFTYRFFKNFKPIVLNAGEAVVVPMEMSDRTPIDVAPVSKGGSFILYCVNLTMLTPSAVLLDSSSASWITEITEGGGPTLLSFRPLFDDSKPFMIYHARSLGW